MMSKALLEKKLCLAKESPEPIFDLSGCNLISIPKIFALIKVLRKECLYLQNNKLKSLREGGSLIDLSLLKVLDLSCNQITKLPEDISQLGSLEVLKLDNNELTVLPNEIGCLKNLLSFSLSSNKLKYLPDNICRLRKLQILDIRKNHLRTLPSTVYQNQNLQSLLLDHDVEWQSPPTSVVLRGINSILSYFAQENNITDFSLQSLKETYVSKSNNSLYQMTAYDEILMENLRKLEKQKEENLVQTLKGEKHFMDQKKRELELHEHNKNEKQKFLVEIIDQQSKIDEEILKVQEKRKAEQLNFIKQLEKVGNAVDNVIKQLIETNAAQKLNSAKSMISFLIDEDPVKDLQSNRVLESMEKLLAEEYDLMKKFEGNDLSKRNFINVSNLKSSEFSSRIDDLLKNRQLQQVSLLEEIKRDANLQHVAVEILLEKSDYRNLEFQNQIALIQNQLSNLTALELRNKNFDMNKNVNEIAERRSALSELLVQIFEQQQKNRNQLVNELRKLENHNTVKTDQYWLLQYQRLLNSQPQSFEPIDPSLIYEMALLGVSHYSPILFFLINNKKNNYTEISDATLRMAGVEPRKARCSILEAIQHYLKDRQLSSVSPSAPKFSEVVDEISNFHINSPTPSAPPSENNNNQSDEICMLDYSLTNECVVCMENQSNVVYLPCGHLCNCLECSLLIMKCPLCRCDIQHKMQIFSS